METLFTKLFKDNHIGTTLVAVITYFIMQMSGSLDNIQKDLRKLGHNQSMYKQEVDMNQRLNEQRLNALESSNKIINSK